MRQNIKEIFDLYGAKNVGEMTHDEERVIANQLRKVKKIKTKEEAEQFLLLLKLVKQGLSASMNSNGDNTISTIVGAFSGGDEGVYSANSDLMNARFVFELVQNVDDCKYKNINDCKLEIKFDTENDILNLEYNETGFTPENVIAITGLGESTKNHKKAKKIEVENDLDQSDLQEIGEKGIGFKSVFGLAKRVTIQSQCFYFSLNRENFFIPELGDYSSFEPTNKTILTLELDSGMVGELFSFLQNKYDSEQCIITENPILFLNKLTEIKYTKDTNQYFGFKVSRDEEKESFSVVSTTIEYFSSDADSNRSIEAYRFSKNIEYTVEECRSRYGEQEEEVRQHRIVVVAPKKPLLMSSGRIYSFFATEERISAPFIIHAPFRLNSGRTRIDQQSQGSISSNLWFNRTKQETLIMIRQSYRALAVLVKNRIKDYIPKESFANNACALYSEKISRKAILELPLFTATDGQRYPATEICFLKLERKLELEMDEYAEIYDLLDINMPLLDVEPSYCNAYKQFDVVEINGITKSLFINALHEPEKTIKCSKYLENYSPQLAVADLGMNNRISITYDQLTAFAKCKHIVSWINSNTQAAIIQQKSSNIDRNKYILVSITDCNLEKVETTRIQKFCSNYREAINCEYLHYIEEVKYVRQEFEDSIFTANYVFGRNMLDDFAALYKNVEPKDKFFSPFLQVEATSDEIDELCEDGERISDELFLKKLYMLRVGQKSSLDSQYDSILKLIEESGTSTDRFFPEILQNIDDCIYTEPASAQLQFKSEGELVISYNETGFTREQIRAITAIGDSTKKELLSGGKTGEKGIGFKSVFALCSVVTIKSGSFDFTLTDDAPTVPVQNNSNVNVSGTVMTFKIKPRELPRIRALLADDSFVIKNCICLKNLKQIRLNEENLVIKDNNVQRTVFYGDHKYSFYKYIYQFSIVDASAIEERKELKEVSSAQEITYLAAKNNFDQYELEGIYTTFPTEEKVNVPIIIDAPLVLNTAREHMPINKWNREVLKNVYRGLIPFYNSIKRKVGVTLPKFFPRSDGKVIDNANIPPSYGHELVDEIRKADLFKLFHRDGFVSLNAGIFGKDIEYYILSKFGDVQSGALYKYVPDLLEYDAEYYEKLKNNYYAKDRTFEETCELIANKFSCLDKINITEFRDKLYEFLVSNDTKGCAYIKKWSIIPIKYHGDTSYVAYSLDIFAPTKNNINSTRYKILDTDIMSAERFNRIFSRIDKYSAIKEFSNGVIVTEFINDLVLTLKTGEVKSRAEKILELYIKERELFELAIKTRKDFPTKGIPLVSRTGGIVNCDSGFCLTNDSKSQGCLDEIIISEKYIKLANTLKTKELSAIDNIKQIPFRVNLKELRELDKCKYIVKKKELFESIYLSSDISEELADGEGFFELYSLLSSKSKSSQDQPERYISINRMLLEKYATTINVISFKNDKITFNVDDSDFEEFDKDDILSEIEDELQVRKETDTLVRISRIISNCYYAGLGNVTVIRLHTNAKDYLLINSNITSEEDIISNLKIFFKKYFNVELGINREITPYNSQGFERISTIMSNTTIVECVRPLVKMVDIGRVDSIKDWLCRPISVGGVTYGGYAKTCPLCGAVVHTELTGFRIYKTKQNGIMVPLIACGNCFDNLRYSRDLTIDTEKLKAGVLDMSAKVNGYTWSVKDITIRLGHRALIREMNKNRK